MKRIKKFFIGKARDVQDARIFHQLSLIAFLAWVGLGSDGLSSSCYGPEEAFRTLGAHPYLGIFVALGSGLTIFIISASYSHIIELFPTGGGGYLVASKLLSPTVGMVSGCALLIDYVLTITISIASGADAIFSFLPSGFLNYKLTFSIIALVGLLILNLRGVKEAVLPLVPIFLTFVAAHLFAIIYTFAVHAADISGVVTSAKFELSRSSSELGLLGLIFLVLKSYSMGAGTFTGIEAVSNGLPILRDPKVKTAHKTMRYMAVSLSLTAMGLMFAYLLFQVTPQHGKTLNAVLFEKMTIAWNKDLSYTFIYVILLSEAILLFIAAQTGFLDGPRVLANMAIDRWFPTRFGMLSDRLVTQNGILLMGGAAFAMMLLSRGSVQYLLVLYSINVFITFSLSQLGMVRHWWKERNEDKKWLRKLLINGIGLILTSSVLILVIVLKFGEGGWITLVITGALVSLAVYIKKHYRKTVDMFKRLDTIVDSVEASIYDIGDKDKKNPVCDSKAKTAALLVNGFNGLGLHTLLSIIRLFSNTYKNFVFIQVGSVDAGNFKGINEIGNLKDHIEHEVGRYIQYVKENGYYAEAFTTIGTDVVEEINKMIPKIMEKFPNVVFFGGQVVFPEETFLSRWLHNFIVFAVQRKLYQRGIPFFILPIRV